MAEYETRVPAVLAQELPAANIDGALGWLRSKCVWIEPMSLGKQRSRDIKDEKFIAAALGGKARAIVSYDNDLLVLEKPFGVPVMRPAVFLRWIEST